jgi:uncharacterized FlaG/YvyC family protein
MEINAAKSFAGSYSTESTARSQTPKIQSVKTDIPAEKAVKSSEEASRTAADFKKAVADDTLVATQNEAEKSDHRSYESDSESGQMIFRKTDEDTGVVIVQIPSEMQLKIKNYTEEAPGAGGYRSESLNTKLDTTI